jgi:hypothetical protein
VYSRLLISERGGDAAQGGGDAVIDLKVPEGRQDAGCVRRGAAGVLVVAIDETGLAEALPVAFARAAALGARVTVAGSARMPFWWAVAASGWMMMPRPWAEESRLRAETELRAAVSRIGSDAECCVVCRHGRAEVWLGRILGQGRYETVLVGATKLGKRRTRRLHAIAGGERTFAVLTPLGDQAPRGAPRHLPV